MCGDGCGSLPISDDCCLSTKCDPTTMEQLWWLSPCSGLVCFLLFALEGEEEGAAHGG